MNIVYRKIFADNLACFESEKDLFKDAAYYRGVYYLRNELQIYLDTPSTDMKPYKIFGLTISFRCIDITEAVYNFIKIPLGYLDSEQVFEALTSIQSLKKEQLHDLISAQVKINAIQKENRRKKGYKKSKPVKPSPS